MSKVFAKKHDIVIKKNPRAKRMSITVHRDCTVTVTQPRYASRLVVNLFILSRHSWIQDKVAYFKSLPPIATATKKTSARKQYLEHKEAARTLVNARLKHFNAFYGHTYNTVAIKNLRTRWGSCSSRKNLNFNFKIVFLTPEQQDYIIVHELCHLREMNHSLRFWALVAQQIPQFKEIRRSVRKFDL